MIVYFHHTIVNVKYIRYYNISVLSVVPTYCFCKEMNIMKFSEFQQLMLDAGVVARALVSHSFVWQHWAYLCSQGMFRGIGKENGSECSGLTVRRAAGNCKEN